MGASSFPPYVLVRFTEESGSPFSVYETKFVELDEGVKFDNFDYSQVYRSIWPMNKKNKAGLRYPCKVIQFSDSLLGLKALCKNLVDGVMTIEDLEEERLTAPVGDEENCAGTKKLTKTGEEIDNEVIGGNNTEVRVKRKRIPSTKLKDNFVTTTSVKKKDVPTKFAKRTASQQRNHSKDVGRKILNDLNRLEDADTLSSPSDDESDSAEEEVDEQDVLEQQMGIVPKTSTRKQSNNKQKKDSISQSFKSYHQLNREGLSDNSQFSSSSAFGQLNVAANEKKNCTKCSNNELQVMKLQSDLSLSHAKNQTLLDTLTSSDAKQSELQDVINYYEVSRPTTKLGLDIQKLIKAHVSGPVSGNLKSSTSDYSDSFGPFAWKPEKPVEVSELDLPLRQNPPSLPALKKTIPPTVVRKVESVGNVKMDPSANHVSEKGSGDEMESSGEHRFPIPDYVLDLFSTKTLSNFVSKTLEYLHPTGDYLATRNLSDRNQSAQKIQSGNASDKISMTEEEIQQVVATVQRKFKTPNKCPSVMPSG